MSIKIIQSFWSKPFLEKNESENARFKAGWSSTNLFFYSALLSCLSFKKHYKSVTMYTDVYGKKLFEDLQIPYNSINTELVCLNDYPSELWALGKILTYSLQDQPFLHADTDVFIWNSFSESYIDTDLFFQNLEFNFPRYKEVLNIIQDEFKNIPSILLDQYLKSSNIIAYNAGIIGGKNLSFFKELAKIVFSFINDNKGNLHKIDLGIFNMIYEQMLGMNLAIENKLKTNHLYSEMNPTFSNVMKFHIIPEKEYYIHTVGDAKKSLLVCEQIEALLRYEYPKELNNLNSRLKNLGLFDNNFKSINNNRFKYLQKIYDWLRNTSWKKKIKTNFILNPECSVEETENNEVLLHYISPQDSENAKIKLEGWDVFLGYFEEKNTIKGVALEAFEDESISSKFKKNQLEEKLFSLIMARCMYNEVILPEFI